MHKITDHDYARQKSTRRLSPLGAVLLGRAMFGEPDLPGAWAPTLLACAGAACLLFGR